MSIYVASVGIKALSAKHGHKGNLHDGSIYSDDDGQGWKFLSRDEFNHLQCEYEQFRCDNQYSLRNLQQAFEEAMVRFIGTNPDHQ